MLVNKTLSKIMCKWKQDSAVSIFLYLDSVFKYKHKLVHNQSPAIIGCVHFFSISISERYTVFFTASSEGNESFDFVYFLIFPFRFSMRLVVYIIFLISSGNWKKTVRSSQLFLHESMAYGYFPPHFFSRLSSSVAATSLLGAL